MVELIALLAALPEIDPVALPVSDQDDLLREAGRLCRPGGLPDRPTDHKPGSPGKLLVMRKRASLGQQLFHPHDAR